ncbi:endonuclease [Marinobacter orientalis]|uniref:Endonuclease I n=1 Tax=Marinobacter orientalis TaxID=1928859 RepID=A0A7Y0RFT3_9GAMM|nr:endonuclease [Marinobacter orientalis]NMT65435.1 endonuclease I [Marinobacter orientalis]TGX47340.1 endonuclease I [Marinobacter orientalis]
MKTLTVFLLTLSVLLASSLVSSQNTRFSDPETVVQNEFWGKLHARGGTSFFCETPFTSKGFLLTEGYIYPLAQVRSALDCGTTSQCANHDRYRQIASDLHNMVPVRNRIEMRRRNARYEELGSTGKPDECDIRESAQFFEPPHRVKGDVARTVAYMVDTYDLPWAGASGVFKSWNRMDPPDDRELTRHRQVAEIQGNENSFVLEPGRLENL